MLTYLCIRDKKERKCTGCEVHYKLISAVLGRDLAKELSHTAVNFTFFLSEAEIAGSLLWVFAYVSHQFYLYSITQQRSSLSLFQEIEIRTSNQHTQNVTPQAYTSLCLYGI